MPEGTYYLAIMWTYGPFLLGIGTTVRPLLSLYRDPTQATQPGGNEG